MCDPLTIAGLVATAGGAAASMSAQSSVDNARSGVMAAERIRQQGLDQQADALNLTSRNRYQDFQGQQDKKASTLGDFFKQPTPQGSVAQGIPEQGIVPASSNNIVVQEQAKKGGMAQAYVDQQGGALGQLRSFGDLLGGIGRDQAKDATLIGQIGNFKRGSANVMPLELEDANHAGDGTKFLGDVLSGLGKVGMTAGLSGGSLPGLGGTAAGPMPILAKGFAPAAATPIGAIARLPSFAQGQFNPFKLY